MADIFLYPGDSQKANIRLRNPLKRYLAAVLSFVHRHRPHRRSRA